MFFTFEAACGSFIGNGRSHNEDNFYFNKRHLSIPNMGLKAPVSFTATTNDPTVFAVFDGMGGEAHGEKAANLCAEVFTDKIKEFECIAITGKEFFYRVCDEANKKMGDLRRQLQVSSMGTTFSSLYFSQDEVVAGNVGDSKIFRLRDKQMLQISEDHTDEKIIRNMGVNKKPVLLQFVGMDNTEMVVEPYISKGEIHPDDIYIVCSDGVTDVLNTVELYEIVTRYTATEAVNQILAQVNIKDGKDNATVIVIKIL